MKYLIFSFFLVLSCISAQSTVNHLFVPSGFIVESISGYGYSKTMSNQSNISSSNPAAMDKLTSFSLGFSYQLESDIAPGWIGDIGITRYKRDIPQSAGLVLPYKNLRIGAGYSQKYNCSLLFGDLRVTTVENPNGTIGEYVSLTDKADLFRYSGLISYGFSDLFSDMDRLSLGAAINYDWLNYHYAAGMRGYDPERELKSHGSKVSFSGGVTYASGLKNLFSLFYESGVEFDKMRTDLKHSQVKGLGYPTLTDDFAQSRVPAKVHLGYDHSFTGNPQITTTLSYIAWNKTDKDKEDQLEASASYIYSPLSKLFTSIGLFYTDQVYNNSLLNQDGRFRTLYITAGIVSYSRLFDFDLVVADNHLTSGKNRKETICKALFGFHL